MKEEWAEFEIRGPVYQLATEISHGILTYSKPDITASFFLPTPSLYFSSPSGCLTYLKQSKYFSEKHSFYPVLYTNTLDALILLADSFYLVHTISHGNFFTVKEVTWVGSAFSAPMCCVVQWIRSSCLSIFKSDQICGSVSSILRGSVGLWWWIFIQEGWVWVCAPALAQLCPTVFNPMEISSPEYWNG